MSSPIRFSPSPNFRRERRDTPRPEEGDLERRLGRAPSLVGDLCDLWEKQGSRRNDVEHCAQGLSPERVTRPFDKGDPESPPPVSQEDLFECFGSPSPQEPARSNPWQSTMNVLGLVSFRDAEVSRAEFVEDLYIGLHQLSGWVDGLKRTWRKEFLAPPHVEGQEKFFDDIKSIKGRSLGRDEIIDAYINAILRRFGLNTMTEIYRCGLALPENFSGKLPLFLSKAIDIDYAGRFSDAITERSIAERIVERIAYAQMRAQVK